MIRRRIEPVLGEPAKRQPLVPEQSSHSVWSELSTVVKLASLAVVLACVNLLTDRGYQHYREHRVVQEAIVFIEQIAVELAAMDREVQAHHSQQCDTRASPAQGRWMRQNCQHWYRSFGNSRLPTAHEEVLRHCRAYKLYLEAAEFRVSRS